VGLSHDEIAEIIRLVDGSSLDELVVDTGDVKLVVRRNGATGRAELFDDRPRPSAQSATGGTAAAKIETAAGQVEVAAPMVGTFYRAPRPDAPPFVEVGGSVRPGQPLCIIEVMKLFTTINSEVAGKVVQVGAENGELVEYGRTLFVIEPV
jgi:acetyl-CoA carboxylase biotin carboxyl carrier protein